MREQSLIYPDWYHNDMSFFGQVCFVISVAVLSFLTSGMEEVY